MSSPLQAWLSALGLAQYADRFDAEDLDLDVLPSLSEHDLAELGVSMGHRKRLLKAIAELPSAPASAPLSGTAPAAPAPPAGTATARKVVTVVFADLIGSTALHEQLDAESVTRLMERYYRAMREAIEAHGGTVVKLMGDGVMAAFGVPNVAEDDAIRAVRAGMAMQDAFGVLARTEFAAVGSIGLRVGINTGEVVVAAGNTDVVGDPVNVAARLQAEAHDGDVVIGEATRRLVAARVTLAPLGSFALKGRTEAIKAYRVESLEPVVGAGATAFVGRDDELARIMAVHEAAAGTPATRLVVLLGSPGLGKSRLIEEVTHRLGDAASVVTAHCDAAGGATFAPVAAALRRYFQIDAGANVPAMQATIEAAIPVADTERGRIAGGIAALLAGSPASPEETFFVIRRLLAGLAATKPVVLVIDDLHWAEPLLLDLVEHLVQWGSGTPLFVLLGARPELRELRSSMVTPGGLVSDVVTLAGLDAGAAMRLAANVIGAADLPAAVAGKVLATTEGNPLFVGELVRMLVDEGAIERQGERWIVGANLAALEMPPTIHALLAARIERLAPEDRAVLERAAVVGRHFSRSAVAALLGRDGGDINARLEALQRTELIERDTGWFLGEPVLRFHHVLIRDAAYRRLLKGTRAELHEQLANWIEAQVQDAPEHDETIGWHLEQAHQHRRELGPLDAHGRALGARAATRLAAAGQRALARDDLTVAAGLLGRAIDRLDPADTSRAAVALDWCEAVLATGDVGTGAHAIDELGRFVADSPRLRAWHTSFASQLTAMTAPDALQSAADGVAVAAGTLAELGDAAGEAKAHAVHAQALARLGKIGPCEAALDRALAAARRAGDRRRANAVLAGSPLAALWGPSPVTRASGRCLDVVRVLRITQGAPAVEAVALSCQAVLEALRGRTEAARRMVESARALIEELGISHRLFEADVFAARIEMLEGRAAVAERLLRGAYDGLRSLGLGIDAAQAAASLGRALLAQDRPNEAETLSHESEALAGDDLQAAIAWRGVRAEALARRGEHVVAVEFAQAAVAIAATTDALLDQADARLALAAALRAAGRTAEGDAEERRAYSLWEAKGATLLLERGQGAPALGASSARGPEPRKTSTNRREIRLPPLAASMLARFEAAFAAGDIAAIEDYLAGFQERVDHPTGAVYGRDGMLKSLRALLRAQDPTLRNEPLAVLGERLSIVRQWTSARGTTGGHFDVAAFEREEILLAKSDESWRPVRSECFAGEHLGRAIARLYERHAELLPEGPARTRAAAIARSVGYCVSEREIEQITGVFAPTIEANDHRTAGYGSLRGAPAVREAVEAMLALSDGFTWRVDDVLALTERGLVVCGTNSGLVRATGGEYERELLHVFVFGSDGSLTHWEMFEPDRADDALARFGALTATTGPSDPAPPEAFRTAAGLAHSRSFQAMMACWRARDWDGVSRLLPSGFRYLDRRRFSQLEMDRDQWVAFIRQLGDMRSASADMTSLATRGVRLGLLRLLIRVSGPDTGPSEIEQLVLTEVDADGAPVAMMAFDPDALDAAYAELDARWNAQARAVGDRAGIGFDLIFREAFAARDWDTFAGLLTADMELHDHRPLSFGTVKGAAEYLRLVRTLPDLAPDVRLHLDHLLTSRRGVLAQTMWLGTRDGGAFETPFLTVCEFDAQYRMQRLDVFPVEAQREARARFDAIDPPSAASLPRPRFENLATRAWYDFASGWHARDWPGLARLRAPGFRFFDRSRIAQLELDAEQHTEYVRSTAEMDLRQWEGRVIATRGERLALAYSRIVVATGDVGESEIANLFLYETDERGAITNFIRFDVDDLDAAYAELDARYDALEDASTLGWIAYQRWLRATHANDWAAHAAALTPDFVRDDHRLLGFGTTAGAAEYEQLQRLLFTLAPDTRFRAEHVHASGRAHLIAGMWHGTRDGGPFEMPLLAVGESDAEGRVRRFDIYDLDQRDQALARFAGLAEERPPGSTPDPTRIPPNTASRGFGRWHDALQAGDWGAIQRYFHEAYVLEDRRRLFRTTVDREGAIANAYFLRDSGFRARYTLLATAGDRLALHHVLWTTGTVGEASEVEFLGMGEIDAEGRSIWYGMFDVDDRVGASEAMFERYVAGGADGLPPAGIEFAYAIAAHDLARVRRLLHDDFVFHDRRRTGVGRIEGADAYLPSLAAVFELSPDARLEALCTVGIRPNARVGLNRWWGTNRAGGAFEILIAAITYFRDGLHAGIDIWEPEDIAAAVAHFESLD